MPTTYGPEATIPSRGFLPDPERLLRRRSTFPPRRQAALTGIDAIMKALVDLTVASPLVIDEELDDDEGDEENIEEEEEFRLGEQEIARYDGGAIENDVKENEGYETGVPKTPVHVADTKEDNTPPLATVEEGYA